MRLPKERRSLAVPVDVPRPRASKERGGRAGVLVKLSRVMSAVPLLLV